MLRFVIDKFRQAPGPLKGPRLIAADLAEEVLELVKYYLDRQSDISNKRHVNNTFQNYSDGSRRAGDSSDAQSRSAAAYGKDETANTGVLSDVDPDLRAAINKPGNQRKQDFKVLAILLDAKHKNLGPLSAKNLSKHGEKLNLQIRHENARKVIRERLDKLVTTHSQGIESSTIYRYEITSAGIEYLKTIYF